MGANTAAAKIAIGVPTSMGSSASDASPLDRHPETAKNAARHMTGTSEPTITPINIRQFELGKFEVIARLLSVRS
jgi:hypothetical protein